MDTNYAKDVFNLQNTTTQPMASNTAFNPAGFSGMGRFPSNRERINENFQFTDDLSIIKGKHNIRTGVQIMRLLYFQITNFAGNPTFTFDGRYTGAQTAGSDGRLPAGLPSRARGSVGDGSRGYAHDVLERLRAG